jgi:hypothetical protein
MTPEARRILVEAKGLVSAGWFRGDRKSSDQHCVLTALQRVGGFKTARLEAQGVLARCLGGKSIVFWNDAPERTHEEVVALFDKALLSLSESDVQPLGRDTGASGSLSERPNSSGDLGHERSLTSSGQAEPSLALSPACPEQSLEAV